MELEFLIFILRHTFAFDFTQRHQKKAWKAKGLVFQEFECKSLY